MSNPQFQPSSGSQPLPPNDPTLANASNAALTVSMPTTMAPSDLSPTEQAAIGNQTDSIPMVQENVSAPGQNVGPVLSDTAEQTIGKVAAYGLPGMGIGLIDTLGQSLGVFDDKTVQDAMSKLSPDGLGDFYARNKTALRTGGEIAGMFIPGMIGTKVLSAARYAREAGYFGEAINSGKVGSVVDALLGSTANMTNLELRVQNAAKEASNNKFGVWAGKSVTGDPDLSAAKRAYYTSKVVESARQSAAMEAGYRLLYNDSETMNPADYTLGDQLKWGAGFAVGAAALELVSARYAVRRLIQGATKDAAPISQFQSGMSDVIFRPNNRGAGLTYTAALKSELKARQVNAPNPTQATNLNSDITNTNSILSTQLQAMAQDTHPVISKTVLSPAQVKLGVDALSKDETTFLYATKLGQVPPNANDFYSEIAANQSKAATALDIAKTEFSSLGKKANTPVAKQEQVLNDLRSANRTAALTAEEQHYVVESNGSWSPFVTRAPNYLDTNDFKSIARSTFKDTISVDGAPTTVIRSQLSVPGQPWKLNDDFTLEGMPQTAQPSQWSAYFGAASKLIDNYRPIDGQQFVLNENMPWQQIEGTLALANKYPDVAGKIQYAGKFENASDAMFNVVDQKYQQWLKIVDKTERKPVKGGNILQSVGTYSPAEQFQILNLPQPLGTVPHPLLQTFAQGRLQGMKSLEDMFLPAEKDFTTPNRGLDMLQQNMREAMGQDNPATQYAISGGLFQQKDIRPIFVAAKAVPSLARSDQVIHSLIESNRDYQLQKLGQITPQMAPLVSKVIGASANLAATDAARDVQALTEGVVSGRGVLTAQDRIADQEPVLKAATLVAQNNEKIILNHLSNRDGSGIFDQAGLQSQAAVLKKQNNFADLLDVNRGEHSYRFGWDIKSINPNPDGTASFALNENSPINKQLFEKYFPDLEADADKSVMPDMSIAGRKAGMMPLRISKNAGDFLTTVSSLSRKSGIENNAIRWALGLPPIKLRDFHLPTPALSQDGTWFVKNGADKVVATYATGSSSQNRSLAEKAAQAFSSDGEQHVAISLDEVSRQHDIFADDALFNLTDYSDQLRKDGRQATGGMAKVHVDTGPQTIDNMMNSLVKQYMNVGTRSQAMLFEPELNYAKQASELSGLSAHFKEYNIWDRYRSILYNTTPSSREGAVRQGYNKIENLTDGALSYLYATAADLGATTPADKTNAQNLKNLIHKSSSDNLYKQYQKIAEDYSPFQDAVDFAESTFRIKTPPDTRSMMAQLSRISSTTSLRFLDVGTAINNLAGLMTNAPGVIAALRPLGNENADQHLARTASWGVQWTPGITTLSPMKAMANVTKALFDGSLAEPMAAAAKRGMFEEEYSSIAKAFGADTYQSKTNLQKFMHAATLLADSSERTSRMFSWGMGYKIAKDLGKVEDEGNAFIFANQFANDMIGNYAPQNKPIMFQGALGLPLGSFQTYMFNLYRRHFGYIESGNKRALVASYAAQASLFGAKSVPGFGLFNNFLLNNPNTGDDLQSRTQRNLPPAAYELLMHGSLSSIPAIFGEGGLAFYTRGSVDMTQLPPSPMELNRSPPFQFLSNTAEGIKRTIANVFSNEGFSLQQQEEILANFSTNRAVKNIMEMAANAKTDRSGNLVDAGTRDAIHLATLVTGAQPTKVQNLTDAYYKQSQVQLNQQSLRTQLNDHTRSLLRGNEFDISDLQGLVHDYTQSGGNPAYLGEWLRNNMAVATTPKSQTKLKQLMSSQRGVEFMNMLAGMQQ